MKIGENLPQDIIAGDFPRVTTFIALSNNNTQKIIPRGTLITQQGTTNLSTNSVAGILAIDVDITDGAKVVPIYLSGEFLRNKVYKSDGSTLSDLEVWTLRSLSIFLKNSIAAE